MEVGTKVCLMCVMKEELGALDVGMSFLACHV